METRLVDGYVSRFAAFRAAVLGDARLPMWLRAPLPRDAYVARVVEASADVNCPVEAADVWAALRAGQDAWLMQGVESLDATSVSDASSAVASLFGWTPFRAAWHGPDLLVDWCHLDARRMTEPFFFETLVNAMREPFNLVFQQRTPIDALAALPPGLTPSGFVFHMSRCGSTLISQALAAFEGNIVVSEAAPLRTALGAARSGRAAPGQAKAWFASLINAYAQQRFSYETRFFVKFMAADVFDIALVREAFPEVPWIFVTRDPAEIMASQEKIGGIDLIRGQSPPHLLDLDEAEVWSMDPLVYQAHVLAAFGRAALAAYPSGKGLILDYRELPDALWTTLPAHFGFSVPPAAAELMAIVSQRHSKTPATPFVAADDPNRHGAAKFRAVADAIAGPTMAALSALRTAR